MDNPTLLLLLLDSVTHVFYLPLAMTSCLGRLRYEERESSHHGFGRCVLGRESGMPQWPEFGVWKMIYLMMRMYRKSQLISLNFVIPLV
jgi:hypothetical protein